MWVVIVRDMDYGGDMYNLRVVGPFKSQEEAEQSHAYTNNVWSESMELENA